MSFTCPRCNMTSHHPEDERQGYCGHCHAFTGTLCAYTWPLEDPNEEDRLANRTHHCVLDDQHGESQHRCACGEKMGVWTLRTPSSSG